MEETRILNPLSESISFLGKTRMNNINTQVFNALNNMDIVTIIYCSTFLYSLSIDKQTCIDSLRIKFKKPTIFLKRACRNVCTNPFGIHAGNIWQANTHLQFILDPYAAASYCTFYLTKIDKTVTQELNKIIANCTKENIEANIRIPKMGNAFLNVQQMSAQLVVYVVLSIPLYHASRSFKFINTSPPQERTFILKM